MTPTLTIGDTTRDGLLQIVDTADPDDGTLRVTVRELIGSGCWIGGFPLDRARRLAQRAVAAPGSTRMVRRFAADGCDYATFIVDGYVPET